MERKCFEAGEVGYDFKVLVLLRFWVFRISCDPSRIIKASKCFRLLVFSVVPARLRRAQNYSSALGHGLCHFNEVVSLWLIHILCQSNVYSPQPPSVLKLNCKITSALSCAPIPNRALLFTTEHRQKGREAVVPIVISRDQEDRRMLVTVNIGQSPSIGGPEFVDVVLALGGGINFIATHKKCLSPRQRLFQPIDS